MVKNILLVTTLLLSLNVYAKVDTLDEHDGWNGCSGTPSWLEQFTLYTGFTRACNTHDWGYTRIGSNKADVDYTFKHNLKKACSANYSSWNPQYYSCKETADLMYRAVRESSDASEQFGKAQIKARGLVLEDIPYQGNANYKDISASRPVNGYADKSFNIHQPYYFHMIDERFLDVVDLIKSGGRYPINLTNAEVWEMLEDGVRSYIPNETGEVSILNWTTKWKEHYGWESRYQPPTGIDPNLPCGGANNPYTCY